ncbi:MAG: nickel pincer cofactor biosynthesis protein LarC [Methanophagales archaeon]|nr:nickel pincer cofactor biosynthesis protein LarC [Methanophagales archaeon]
MKALVFEPFSGASGDMVIGSLLDLGVDESKIRDTISVFDLELEVKEVKKRGIVAKKVEFVSKSKSKKGAERKRSVNSYKAIMRTIEDSGLSKEIIQNSVSVFERIANAEAKVHGEPKDSLTFHELGALDTIGDLVGSSTAFLDIHADIIISTPISVGSGFVDTEHGLLPVPAPATVEILRHTSLLYQGGPFASASISELLTPTGAAIFAHFVQRSEPFLPQMRIEKTGYGAGTKDLPAPNVLRASVGEIEESVSLLRDEVEVLETNVDNVTGEVLGNLTEILMAEGAKDVAILPAQMKKGRSGHIIKVITAPQDVARIALRIMEETGSLGVRVMQVKHRFIANREQRKVKVRIKGAEKEVGVKIGRDAKGNLLNVAAEFEDAKRVATELKMPLKEVIKLVEENARKNLSNYS